MSRASRWLSVVVGSFLVAATAFAQAPAPGPAAVRATADSQVQDLLAQLSKLSDSLIRNVQSPQAWRYQLEQADVLLQLAACAGQGEERDSWLKMAIEGYYSAAVQSPANEPTAQQRLAQLPERIARDFPGNRLSSHAALRDVQADCTRALAGAADPVKTKDYLRHRLLRFAKDHPWVPEAAKALMDAGHLAEALGMNDDARRCYRYLTEAYSKHSLSQEARAAMRRLGGLDGETVALNLPLLYSPGAGGEARFDLKQMRGDFVLVHFWSSTSPHTAEAFQALKRLTDRSQDSGLQVVYINLDSEPASARAFLSGCLTAGTHVYQSGGLTGAVAQHYGIQKLPHTLLVGKNGALLRHSLEPADFETALGSRLAGVEKRFGQGQSIPDFSAQTGSDRGARPPAPAPPPGGTPALPAAPPCTAARRQR
jgi:hypothetical protein